MKARTFLTAGLLVGTGTLVAACTDRGPEGADPAGPATITAEAPPIRVCETRDAERAARSFFSDNTDVRTVRDVLALLEEACETGDDPGVETYGWQLLALAESALGAGATGAASDGADFVNAIVDCLENQCVTDRSNDLNVEPALGEGGLFGVRNGDEIPVIARDPIAFTDFDPKPNLAVFALETDLPWDQVTGTPYVLFYGAPVANDIDLQDVGIGGLQFDMNRYPVPPVGTFGNPFEEDALHVVVCFESDFKSPHEPGQELKPRVQREAVLLENYEPVVCGDIFPQTLTAASLAGPAISLVRSLLPTAWFVRDDRLAGSIGGTPLEFSTFAPVAADVAGSLEFVKEPRRRSVEGQSIGEIQVRALSGAGTPIERVKVTLSIKQNQGEPAGAEISGDFESYTDEAAGIATFPDEGGQDISVGKPGGYLLCANGVLSGFTFPEVCSSQFFIGNENGNSSN